MENSMMENGDGNDNKTTPECVFLDDLHLNSESKCILVRVLRTWEAHNFKRNKELMSVDVLLLDEKDCLIQGSIHHLLLNKFRNKLIEGQIFIIRDFDVFRSANLYRISDHQHIIRFTDSSSIEEVDEAKKIIPLEKFNLHSRDELLKLVDKNEILPDVIGFLCQFEKAKAYGENKAKRAVLHIFLEEHIKTRLTIWDNMVDTIEEKLKETNERTIVIVATSLLPKKFSRTLCLNPSSATKIYLNANFEAIRDFRGRIKNQPEFDHSYKTVTSNNLNTQLHSISEILNFISNEKEQEKEFTCNATIKEVILRNGWNYISCSRCARKMEKTETTLTCKYCKESKSVGVLRFRIEVVVDDGTDSTTFVIFDKEAKKITKTTATTLMEDKEEHTDKDKHDQAPTSVLNIVGETHTFQVKITNYNFRAKYQSFTVSRILDDILATEIEESQQKEKEIIKIPQGSSSTKAAKIKIEDKRKEKEAATFDKEVVKRRKVQRNGKKPSLQNMEESE